MFRKMQFYQRMLLIVVAWSGLIATPQAFAYKQITAGGQHTCGLKNDGSAICWGLNDFGQSTASGTFTQLSAGGYHTCGLKSDGSAVCWGDNRWGQSTVPSSTFIYVQAGAYHTCGLGLNGRLICWGDNHHGQTFVPSNTSDFFSLGWSHSCGLSDGSAICWGAGKTNTGIVPEYGQSIVPSDTSFGYISAGAYHTCGLGRNRPGRETPAVCWGDNRWGQSTVPSGEWFIQISAGGSHTCGLKSDGSAICWGNNGDGRTTVPSGTFIQLRAGADHTCGLKSDGSAICWGKNAYGQTTVPVDSTSPTSTGKINGISTRAPVGTTAEKYMMAGVFVQGTTQKQALVRATGKGLMKQGVNTTLNANLEVYQLATSTSVPVDKNDDWKNHSSYSTVQAAGGMSDDSDAALVTGLKQGYYSMVVMPSGGSMTSGGGSSQGIGLVEVYDNDHSSTSRLSGISTRSYVGSSAADYMYAGLAIQGDVKLLIRGLGKGLIAQGVTGALDDAMITVRNGNGTVVNSNDNWQTHSSSSTLTQRGQAPTDSSDAAMIINLSEGLYTIEVKSARGGQGVALVEVYEIVD